MWIHGYSNIGPHMGNSKLGVVIVADSKVEPTVELVDSVKAKVNFHW